MGCGCNKGNTTAKTATATATAALYEVVQNGQIKLRTRDAGVAKAKADEVHGGYRRAGEAAMVYTAPPA